MDTYTYNIWFSSMTVDITVRWFYHKKDWKGKKIKKEVITL